MVGESRVDAPVDASGTDERDSGDADCPGLATVAANEGGWKFEPDNDESLEPLPVGNCGLPGVAAPLCCRSIFAVGNAGLPAESSCFGAAPLYDQL